MGIQEFDVKLIEKKDLTSDVIELSFSVPASFDFKAGQFVMLRVQNDNIFKFKSYSVLNSPLQKGRIDFCIKIVEGGFASEAFKHIKVGDSLLMRATFGHFVLDLHSDAEEIWMIGTGTGIAPFYSMLKTYLEKSNKKFRLIFGVRTQEALLYHHEFQEMEKKHKNFIYSPTLSREKWHGLHGRVQEQLGEDLQGKDFYICGLKEMVLETQQYLLDHGVDAKRIHFERYS